MSTGWAKSSAAKIKLFVGPNTRQWPRFDPADVPLVKGIRADGTSQAEVVNLSRGGVLMRTRKHLVRGQIIRLNLQLAGRVIPLKGLVMRSPNIYAIKIPRYQAAVAFDSPLPMLHAHPRSLISESKREAPSSNSNAAMVAALLEFSVCNFYDADVREMLKLNNW